MRFTVELWQMAVLMAPQAKTKVVRRAPNYFLNVRAGKWHFVRPGHERKTLCGEHISTSYDVNTSTLDRIKATDICAVCWPFEKSDIAPSKKVDQLPLFPVCE
jgi:hypothetical protein